MIVRERWHSRCVLLVLYSSNRRRTTCLSRVDQIEQSLKIYRQWQSILTHQSLGLVERKFRHFSCLMATNSTERRLIDRSSVQIRWSNRCSSQHEYASSNRKPFHSSPSSSVFFDFFVADACVCCSDSNPVNCRTLKNWLAEKKIFDSCLREAKIIIVQLRLVFVLSLDIDERI